MTGAVQTAVARHVGTLSFANPKQHGALTPEMLDGLREGLASFERSWPQVRAVVLTGADGTFSSGYAIDRIPDAEHLAVEDEIEQLCQAIENSRLPVVALLEGNVVGAALDVACACDFRFATADCRLAITPARLGVVYTWRGTRRVHRLVGPDFARSLFFTGDPVRGSDAARAGLVTRVCDAVTLREETYAFAERITTRAPIAVAGAKRIMRELERAADLPSETAAELHRLRQSALRSPDAAEARAAFQAKRSARFTGEEA